MNLTEYQPHSILRRRMGCSKPAAQHRCSRCWPSNLDGWRPTGCAAQQTRTRATASRISPAGVAHIATAL
jgi:hypothetical protein